MRAVFSSALLCFFVGYQVIGMENEEPVEQQFLNQNNQMVTDTASEDYEDTSTDSGEEYSYSEEEKNTPVADPCLLKIDSGDIQVAIAPQTRWAYNAGMKQCQMFQFIRGGNANNFATEDDCQKMCSGH